MTINVKIMFLHEARPFDSTPNDGSFAISFPDGEIPLVGDIIVLENEHPQGAYFVAQRQHEIVDGVSKGLTLVLGVEGRHTKPYRVDLIRT